jgi:hypothetical protein
MSSCFDHNDQAEALSHVDWHMWAMQKGKTHRQTRCDECGLFKIWVEKAGITEDTHGN